MTEPGSGCAGDPAKHREFSDLRENVPGLGRICLDLSADICHVDPEDPVVVLHVRPPDLADDGVVGDDAACVLPEKRKDPELIEGQVRVDPVHIDPVLVVIDGQGTRAEYPALGTRVSGRHSAVVAQSSADARKELGASEGLGDVVIRPHVQSFHLVPLVCAGGDHQNGHGGPGPEIFQDRNSIEIRQPEIQDHHVGAPGGEERLRLGAGLRGHRLVAVGL